MKIPYLQVRSDSLLFYELSDNQPPRKFKEGIKKAYSGQVTEGAKKRLQKAIDIIIQKSPPRLTYNPVSQKMFPFTVNFITLTFSCSRFIDGKEGYNNMMKPFLRLMRRKGNFSYVWKAEFQDEKDYQGKYKENGGQLHYHLITNTFIHWHEMRKQWNRLQRKNGYLEEYGLKHGHYSANSTDVHSVYKVNSISAYVSKYMCKEGTRKLDGKVWDSSKDCKGKRFSMEPVYEQQMKVRKGVKEGKIKQINLEHCTIFKVKNPLDYLTVSQYKEYVDWRNGVNQIIIKPVKKMEKVKSISQELISLKNELHSYERELKEKGTYDRIKLRVLKSDIKKLEDRREKERRKKIINLDLFT